METVSILKKIVPEAMAMAQTRYRILNAIAGTQRIGRRALADDLQMTERVLRAETDFLRQAGFIQTASRGMQVTNKGRLLLSEFSMLLSQHDDRHQLAEQLATLVGVQHCFVVAGDVEREPNHLFDMAAYLSQVLAEHLPTGENVIAVTGGKTIATVASHVDSDLAQYRSFTIVPARGGSSDELDIQSNSVSDLLAKRLRGRSLPLYVPELIQPETYKALRNEPSVLQTVDFMTQSNCLIYSIGDALEIATRRGMPEHVVMQLQQSQAVGEAFGTFFNAQGDIVYRLPRIGIHLEDLARLPFSVLVVGGSRKAQAFRAYAKLMPSNTIIITDEGLSQSVLKG